MLFLVFFFKILRLYGCYDFLGKKKVVRRPIYVFFSDFREKPPYRKIPKFFQNTSIRLLKKKIFLKKRKKIKNKKKLFFAKHVFKCKNTCFKGEKNVIKIPPFFQTTIFSLQNRQKTSKFQKKKKCEKKHHF